MSLPPSRYRVLIVDDDAVLRALLRRALLRAYEVDVAGSAAAARTLLGENHYDLVLCDVMMPEETGIALLGSLDARVAERVIFMTGGVHDAALHAELGRTGRPILAKPFELTELESTVSAFLCRA